MLPNKVHHVAKKIYLWFCAVNRITAYRRTFLPVSGDRVRATVRHSVVVFGISSQAQRLQIGKSRTSEFL